MEQAFSDASVSILHELDLGQHTLFIMSDGSIDLLANDEQTPSHADTGLRLNSDETYYLFISLQEQFKQAMRLTVEQRDGSNPTKVSKCRAVQAF